MSGRGSVEDSPGTMNAVINFLLRYRRVSITAMTLLLVVMLIVGHGIAGFRDAHGIRPLVLGKRKTARGIEWMLASESVALDMLGFTLERDVAPGEAIYIDMHGRMHAERCAPAARHTPCIFEYVYFARPDSIIDNISVHKARMRMGEKLAEKIQRLRPEHDIGQFDCGQPELNSWLHDWARRAAEADTARTFVVCRASRVVGYFTLSAGAVSFAACSAWP